MLDLTNPEKPIFVNPNDQENSDFIQKGKRDFPELFDEHVKAVTKAVKIANPSREKPMKIETMSDVDELFDSVETSVFPKGTRDRTDLRPKLILIYVGGLVRLCTSLRPKEEGWKVYRQETGRTDKWQEGKDITKSYYWKEPLPSNKKAATSSEIAALKSKLNSK